MNRTAASTEVSLTQDNRRLCALARSFAAWAVFAAALAGGGCITPTRSCATDVDAAAWSTPAEILLPNTDTLALQDIVLFLRCNDRFDEDTLTVRIAVRTPDSLRHEEPFTLVVSRTDTPAALMRVAKIPYRRHVLLARQGDYRVSITPTRTVCGIEAVGIDLVRTEPEKNDLTPTGPAPQSAR